MNKPIKNSCIFEVSWEVCNFVGGINTVIKSKAAQMNKLYNDNYFLIGPFFLNQLKGEFEEKVVDKNLKRVFQKLEKQGIKCHFGKWLIEGQPQVILIDFKDFWWKLNDFKGELWRDYKIDSLKSGYDFNEPLIWGLAVGILIQEMIKYDVKGLSKGKRIVAHFHEWISASGLLYLKKRAPDIATVFTTHATVVGRTLTYNHVDFYSSIKTINANLEADKWQVRDKHQLEKAAALFCDIFTTVSEITASETFYFFKKKPDILTYNGLDLEKFPSTDELVLKKRFQKNRLKQFLLYYFFPYYSFSLENTLFYFISGRYEYKAKGIDIFIKALSKLNKRLNEEKSKKTIVVFFWIPAGVRSIALELLENKEFFQHIQELIKQETWEIDKKILFSLIEKGNFSEKTIFPKNILFEFKKRCLKFRRQGNPLISTHLLEDQNDPIIKTLRQVGLCNKDKDRVKVVFHSIYLTGHDGLLNLNYQEVVQGCDLGVFPSFYEPWGYTPLEVAALGTCAVTSDLTGFGRYIDKNFKLGRKNLGIFILKRFQKKEKEKIEQLTNFLYQFTLFDKHQLAFYKNQARNLASSADWKFFINNYVKAYNQALRKAIKRNK